MSRRKRTGRPANEGELTESEAGLRTDDEAGPIVAPEHKGMATRGISLAGKYTFQQYQLLVAHGYDGNIVMRWTQHRADQEIQKLRRAGMSMITSLRQPKNSQGGQSRPATKRKESRILQSVLAKCRICFTAVRRDRLQKHMASIHKTKS